LSSGLKSVNAFFVTHPLNYGLMSRRREELVPHQPNVVVFDSLVSQSLGPTVHIDVQSIARLKELHAIMLRLAGGASTQVFLSQIGDSHWIPPLVEVVLSTSGRRPQTKYEHRGEQLICKWTDSTEGWLESAEKTGAIWATGKACHQYFKGWQSDSVTIRLAYLE